VEIATAHDLVANVWKTEAPRVVAVLTRIVRDVGVAEELAQDAFLSALTEWPRTGVPDRPGAWLMTTAKNRALNVLRRTRVHDRTIDALGYEIETRVPAERLEAALETAIDGDIADEVLRLVFVACHPVLSRDARVALTLKLIGGLSTGEIARAFLASEPAIAQRIVRAKRTLHDARVPFEMPRGPELGARLASVLEVVYLVFNEGYSATAGEDLLRPSLAAEALHLGRLLAELAPGEAEVLGLLALMELQASRMSARTDPSGEPVLLPDQNRRLWDADLIAQGLAHLAEAEALGGVPGPYRLQAGIAACHARAGGTDDTDWRRIAALYAELAALTRSPVVSLNHAVAISRAEGPSAGLALLDRLAGTRALARYHLLPSARGDLLEQLGRFDEARAEFEAAAALTENVRQRVRLQERARACAARSSHDT
jgi:RNA polymerase sigma factor (sigma-70 family)